MFWWPFGKKKIGLALGGGVARGIAHIGVLKVLQANKIPIDYIAATSSGSLVGAGYAAGMEIALIEQVALHIHWQDLFKLTFFRPGFIDSAAITGFVEKYIGDKDFKDLKIPFAAVATDIKTGAEVVIREGKVAKAVAASAAFPGFFAPQDYDGKHLVDGGIAANLPVSAARKMGAEFVIASDVIPRKSPHNLPKDPLQTFSRSLDLVLKRLSAEEAGKADVLIDLEMEEDIWHLDIHKANKLITAGEIAAHRVINKIKRQVGN